MLKNMEIRSIGVVNNTINIHICVIINISKEIVVAKRDKALMDFASEFEEIIQDVIFIEYGMYYMLSLKINNIFDMSEFNNYDKIFKMLEYLDSLFQ